MSSLNGVSGHLPAQSVSAAGGVSKSAAAKVSTDQADRSDRVELSDVSHFLAKLKTNEVRSEKVASIKAAIEAGTYDDDYKLDMAIDRLLDSLND